MEQVSELWAEKLKQALDDIPEDWMNISFDKIPEVPNQIEDLD